MLTQHEVLRELKRIGVRDPSLLKIYLKDFEKYMQIHHRIKIVKTNKQLDDPPKTPHPPRE